jgi:hypothetical protein
MELAIIALSEADQQKTFRIQVLTDLVMQRGIVSVPAQKPGLNLNQLN